MKLFKKLYIITLIMLILTASTALVIHLKASKKFNSSMLRKVVVDFIETNFKKAVRFDTISMSLVGDIVITNLKISAFDDFNDNILLVDSPQTIIDLDYFALLHGVVQIEDLSLDSATFVIHKPFDYTYKDSFSIISGVYQQFVKSKELSNKRISLKIRNSRFSFNEVLKSDTVLITAEEFDLDLSITRNEISFNTDGIIKKHSTPFINGSPYEIEGSIFFKDGEFHGLSANLATSNLDLSYLNPYLLYKFGLNNEMTGAFSTDASINILHNNASINSNSRFTGFSIKSLSRVDDAYSLLINKDLSLKCDFDIQNAFNKIIIRRVQLNDENMEIKADGEYVNSQRAHFLKTNIRSNKINLALLSKFFKPYKNIDYRGELQFDFSTDYNFLNNKNYRSNINVSLQNFFATSIENGLERSIFKHCSLSIIGTEKHVGLQLHGISGSSDYNVKVDSIIDDWGPLSSETTIHFSSKQFAATLLTDMVAYGHNYFETIALNDTKEGYDGVLFPDKEFGKFIVNNNISLNLKCDSLHFKNNAAIKDIKLIQILKDKSLYTDTFTAKGYGAVYSFDLDGNFKNDFVIIKCKSDFSGLNLGQLYRDTGYNGSLTGMMSGGYEWRVDGYRLRDLILNNESTLNFLLINGSVKETDFQSKFYDFFSAEGIKVLPSEVDIAEANYRLKISSLSYYVNIGVRGNNLNFRSNGSYIFRDGYYIPLTISLSDTIEGRLQRDTGFFKLSGSFLDPQLESRKHTDIMLKVF